MRLKGLFQKAVVTALVLSFIALPVKATPTIKELKEKKQELKSLSEKERQSIKHYEASKNKLEAQIKDLDIKIGDLSDELERLDGEISYINQSIAEKNRIIKDGKREISSLVNELKTKIKFIYENGNRGDLESLLDSEAVSDILNKQEYVGRIYSFDQNKINRLKTLIKANRSAKKELKAKKEDLSDLQEKYKKQQEELDDVLKAKQKDIDDFETKIKDASLKEKAYLSDIEEQDRIIEAAEKAAALKRKREAERRKREEERKKEEERRKKATEQGQVEKEEKAGQENSTNTPNTSGFVWPCPGYRRISSGFGFRRHPTLRIRKMHNGIDMAAPVGTPIVAAKAGEVIESGYNSTMGNYIIIDHGGGLSTIYMHCSKRKVSTGTDVTGGQTIATVGSTGRSTGPHLHFGVKLNGVYVNPANYLK